MGYWRIDVLIIALHFTEIERQSLLSCLQIDVKRVHGTRGTYVYDRGKCSLPLTVNRRGSISVARCTDTFEWNARNFIDIAMTVVLRHCCSALVEDNEEEKNREKILNFSIRRTMRLFRISSRFISFLKKIPRLLSIELIH